MSELTLEIGNEATEPYNLPLQIGGIFVILAASALGVILPLLLYFLGLKHNAFFETTLLGVKTCGVGIIICTGFIHMLGDAGEQLSREEHPDLPAVFDYEAWSYVCAMFAIFSCALADFLVLRAAMAAKDKTILSLHNHHDHDWEGTADGDRQLPVREMQHQQMRVSAVPADDATAHALENGIRTSSDDNNTSKDHTGNEVEKESHDDDEDSTYLSSKWRVVTLESGILVHSVLIGLDMGMQSGSTYDALLIAIAFHQFFEGFALSQILIEARLGAMWILVMAVAFYAITTPVGIAAGIGVHSFYDEGSVSACLTMGILDSVAGGILIYMGLTSLLSTWIVNSASLARAHYSRPLVAFIGLAVGMISMAVVGKWA